MYLILSVGDSAKNFEKCVIGFGTCMVEFLTPSKDYLTQLLLFLTV